MEEFALVEEGGGSLTFFDRKPADPRLPLEEYVVRLDISGLSATDTVFASDEIYLVGLFEALAREWRTAADAREWTSWESEFGVKVDPDRLGHFAVEVTMRRWASWQVNGMITIVTAQLDEVAAGLKAFFGKLSDR